MQEESRLATSQLGLPELKLPKSTMTKPSAVNNMLSVRVSPLKRVMFSFKKATASTTLSENQSV
ncbi:uncharacterized protein METZ01_LOCUS219534, partial [marine metagenome]